MFIRTMLLWGAAPLALLACSARAGSEATEEESAAVTRGPSPSTSSDAPDQRSDELITIPLNCGKAGERACPVGTPCVSGTLDVDGACVACGNIATPFFHTLGMGSDGFVEAVVDWASNPAVPVALFVVDTSDGETYASYYSYTTGNGTWTFPSLMPGKTYQLQASAFEPGELLCPPYATTDLATPPSSVSLSLAANDGPNPPYPADSSAGTLTIQQDGTWSVSGAYLQLGVPIGPFQSQLAQLTCSADPGVTWPTWTMEITGNAFSEEGGTENLTGSGQYSWLTTDWLKIVYETSANCQIHVP